MLDARAAARLASSARSALDLLPVVRGAGCDGDPLPLDDAGLRRLGIAGLVASAHVASGRESLRALMRVGRTYVNVHTTQNPAGEIRGQLALD